MHPYGKIIPQNVTYESPTVEEIRNKSKKIAWFVSHCNAISQRDTLVKKLNKYMAVDVYGKCGKLKCERNKENYCYDKLDKDYKFYLSFENALCKDYITEKLFKILTRNVIPVVYGGADYNQFAPPHSVIDVKKFNTVRKLAEYLQMLDENPQEYLKYFEWKKSYTLINRKERTRCNLCEKLNTPSKQKFYENILNWLDYPGVCESPKVPSIVKS